MTNSNYRQKRQGRTEQTLYQDEFRDRSLNNTKQSGSQSLDKEPLYVSAKVCCRAIPGVSVRLSLQSRAEGHNFCAE